MGIFTSERLSEVMPLVMGLLTLKDNLTRPSIRTRTFGKLSPPSQSPEGRPSNHTINIHSRIKYIHYYSNNTIKGTYNFFATKLLSDWVVLTDPLYRKTNHDV